MLTYESWRTSYQSSEQAARAAWDEMQRLIKDGPNTKQPRSIQNDQPFVWDLVRVDMQERDQIGERKHGARLQPHNGRDVLKDAYQEALDLVVYLRQALYERDGT